jgi:DNA integrity scanning protein DisA with diadenylate cyclase activity
MMIMDEAILAALTTLTAGGKRDLIVLLTPEEEEYELLAGHITIPILVISEDRDSESERVHVVQLREQDREIMLPCRAGDMEDLINLSVALALLEETMAIGCRAAFVHPGPGEDDCVIVLREITESPFEEWYSVVASPLYSRRAVRDVLAVALELGQMRKRPAGAMYVIGDTQSVLARSTQLFMNPFGGQARECRDISDSKVRDTLREYARLDGAVVIDEDGLVQAAGVHVNADTRNVALLVEGARHATAAAISHETKAIAVTVSEKSGTVTVFKAGKVILTFGACKD